jgi:hypothetical protein
MRAPAVNKPEMRMQLKRRVDDIITYALAAILTVMFSWATIMCWPPTAI